MRIIEYCNADWGQKCQTASEGKEWRRGRKSGAELRRGGIIDPPIRKKGKRVPSQSHSSPKSVPDLP
ncbi:hypothetical protein [Altericroceibacterium xinjiangense]|uniref:hypothetical protein n=1 Tax=Altericroceibacterium xinjiangense TaxID=762261 RepID=UPI000F7E0DAA|nr:hypothetical protein [Altericroceibacterium xinjiangense]